MSSVRIGYADAKICTERLRVGDRHIKILVERCFPGCYLAYEPEYDQGRELGEGDTAAKAIADLAVQLESNEPEVQP